MYNCLGESLGQTQGIMNAYLWSDMEMTMSKFKYLLVLRI